MEPYVLETKRLIIRPFTMDNLENAHRVLVEADWWEPCSLDEAREQLKFQINLADWGGTGNIYGWRAIILKESHQLIGMCGFMGSFWTSEWLSLFSRTQDDLANQSNSLELELGYALSKHYRGIYLKISF